MQKPPFAPVLRRSITATRGSWLATLVFFALSSAFGIVAHLVSELAGLGWHDDADLIASPRHGYLAAIAALILAAITWMILAVPASERRNRIAVLVDALPFRGQGPAFVVASFLAQFAFFAVTQIGEGCPLCSGDVFTGVLAAAASAVLGALLITFGKRRLLAFAFALFERIAATAGDAACAARQRSARRRVAAPRNRRRTAFSFRYRPPPLVVALDPAYFS